MAHLLHLALTSALSLGAAALPAQSTPLPQRDNAAPPQTQQDPQRRAGLRNRPTLVPPQARTAMPDENPPAGRGVFEIDQRGFVRFGGQDVIDPSDDAELLAVLKRFRDRDGAQRSEIKIGDRQITLVDDPLLIRADRWTEWRHISHLMTLCARPEIAIWRLELGVRRFRSDEPGTLAAHLPRDTGDLPQETEETDAPASPPKQLRLRIVCDQLGEIEPRRSAEATGTQQEGPAGFERVGHQVHWLIGEQRFDSFEDVTKELTKISLDPSRRVPDRRGGTRMMDAIIEPGPNVSYGDVVQVLDTLRFQEFSSIAFSPVR